MTQKSVIEIDVLDDKFKAFSKELEKVIKALQEQKKVLKETASLREMSSDKFKKSLNEIEKKIKSINPALKDMVSNLDNVNFMFSAMGTVVNGIVGAIGKITRFLAFGALAGGAAMIGIANNASNVRRTALSYGVSTGQLRAARGVYGTYLPNSEQLFGKLADIQQDPNKWNIAANIGLGINEDVGTAFPRIIERIVDIYKRSKGNQALLDATGVSSLMDKASMRALANLPEFAGLGGQYLSQAQKLSAPDAIYATWQKLKQHLDELGQTFQDKLIVKLEKLSPVFDDVIKTLSDVGMSLLDAFGEYLSSPQFKTDAKQFTDNLKELAKVTKDFFSGQNFQDILSGFSSALTKFSYVMDWIAKKLGYETPEQKAERVYKEGFGIPYYQDEYTKAMQSGSWHNVKNDPKLKALAFATDKKYRLPAGTTWATFGQESHWGTTEPLGPVTQGGWRALGYGQFSPYTARSLGLKNPWNAYETADVIGKAYADNYKTLSFLLHRPPTQDELIAAYNSSPQSVYKALVKSGFDDSKFLQNMSKQTQAYVPSIHVFMNDNTENSTIHQMVTINPFSTLPTPSFSGF